jgi:YfiH family protein
MVLAADCVPVVLGARGAVAALHAGWRGLAAGVLQEGVRALRELGGQGSIHAVIGPCAGPCCYEVGEEVLQALGASAPAPSSKSLGASAPTAGSKSLLDLRAHARARLQDAGVAIVEEVELCTICEPRLFSHRREGTTAGRQAAIAWLP